MKQLTVLFMIAAVSSACSSGDRHAKPPDGETSASVDVNASLDAKTDEDTDSEMNREYTRVRVDEKIVESCELDGVDLYFPYDSAAVEGRADNKVRAMADCVTSGNLQGQTLALTGHADPRGTEEYNEELGASRAESVAEALVAAGVDRLKLVVKSDGEEDASSDSDDWPADRRVEIALVE